MHCHAEVYVESLENFKEMVEAIMAPYQERVYGEWGEEDYRGNDYDYSKCFWDWWEIGGRWDKAHSENNISSIKDLPDAFEACTLIVKDQVCGDWRDELSMPVKQKLKDLGITEGYVVTVDYHC